MRMRTSTKARSRPLRARVRVGLQRPAGAEGLPPIPGAGAASFGWLARLACLAALAAAPAAAGAADGAAAAGGTAPAEAAEAAARGRQIYTSFCARCHGIDMSGTGAAFFLLAATIPNQPA